MRSDLEIISDWVQPKSHILDLGCGDGSLLKHLADHHQVSGYGLEINPEKITQCIASGVNVLEQDLDAKGLSNFDDNSFDTVIMTQALQAVRRPDHLLGEMLRLAKECIITFPNFAHWRCRVFLSTRGRMPVSSALPYEWYNTPNIHLCTFRDFENLCEAKSIHIVQRNVVDGQHRSHWFSNAWPNLMGEIAIYRISRKL